MLSSVSLSGHFLLDFSAFSLCFPAFSSLLGISIVFSVHLIVFFTISSQHCFLCALFTIHPFTPQLPFHSFASFIIPQFSLHFSFSASFAIHSQVIIFYPSLILFHSLEGDESFSHIIRCFPLFSFLLSFTSYCFLYSSSWLFLLSSISNFFFLSSFLFFFFSAASFLLFPLLHYFVLFSFLFFPCVRGFRKFFEVWGVFSGRAVNITLEIPVIKARPVRTSQELCVISSTCSSRLPSTSRTPKGLRGLRWTPFQQRLGT